MVEDHLTLGWGDRWGGRVYSWWAPSIVPSCCLSLPMPLLVVLARLSSVVCSSSPSFSSLLLLFLFLSSSWPYSPLLTGLSLCACALCLWPFRMHRVFPPVWALVGVCWGCRRWGPNTPWAVPAAPRSAAVWREADAKPTGTRWPPSSLTVLVRERCHFANFAVQHFMENSEDSEAFWWVPGKGAFKNSHILCLLADALCWQSVWFMPWTPRRQGPTSCRSCSHPHLQKTVWASPFQSGHWSVSFFPRSPSQKVLYLSRHRCNVWYELGCEFQYDVIDKKEHPTRNPIR